MIAPNQYAGTKRTDDAALAAEYMPRVSVIMRQISRRICGAVSDDDLLSAGYLGLAKAIDCRDGQRDFAAYADFRIRGEMLDEIRRLDHATRTDRSEIKRIDRVRSDLTARFSRPPSDDELCAEAGIEPAKLDLLFMIPRMAECEIDTIAADEPECDDSRDLEPLKQKLNKLPPHDRVLLNLVHAEGITATELASMRGVTVSMICRQIHAAEDRARQRA